MCAPSSRGSDAAGLPKERVPLGEIVQWFKTMTTNEFIRGVKESGWPRFGRRLWQRDYFEHVISDEKSLNNIRRYIRANSLMWPHDQDNPQSVQRDKAHRFVLARQLGLTELEYESILYFDDEYRSHSRS